MGSQDTGEWTGDEQEQKRGNNKRTRLADDCCRLCVVSTIAGRPYIRGGAPAVGAGSFDEAADRTGWFEDGCGERARFRCPMGAVQMEDGTIYVTDWGNHSVRKRAPDGMWSTLAGKPGAPGYQDGPGSVARFHHIARITIDWVRVF